MYSEKSFKNYIFWVKVRRIFLIILLTSIGAGLGIVIGKIVESVIQNNCYNNNIIIVSSVVFFLISLLVTVGTAKEVQDGYWKIAVLRKLTVIQKNLELNNELLRKNSTENKLEESKTAENQLKEVKKIDENEVEGDVEEQEDDEVEEKEVVNK